MRIAGLALLAAVALAAPANGATLAVTTTDDDPAPGCSAERCSLRQALAAAAPGDEVRVPAAAQAYRLRSDLGQLVVTQPGVRIVGADTRRTVVAGGGAVRVFAVAGGIREVTISALTITGGAAPVDPRGGGVYVGPRAELTLSDVAVVANSAGAGTLGGYGGGVHNAGTLVVRGSLIANNVAGAIGLALGQGGGIFNAGALSAENVTIAGNIAGGVLALSGGGGVFTSAAGTSRLTNVTVTGNRAGALGVGSNLYSEATPTELRNTIVAGALGAASCGGGVTSRGHNLEDGTSCGLGQPRNAHLGLLQDNGGPTNTRVPMSGSPAVDAGEACQDTDQRGFVRPHGSACDIGAVELDAGPRSELAAPRLLSTVNISRAAGQVLFQVPGGAKFVQLSDPQQVPLGTLVDTQRGVVTLAAARDGAGTIDQANFYDGVFKVGQERDGANRAVTLITLDGPDLEPCAPGQARAAQNTSKKKRRVWGSGKGRFRTRGRHSSATVRGTRWLTEDRCDGTYTVVRSGVVEVEDFTSGKRVLVRPGGQYVARAPQCVSRRRFRVNVPVARALRVRRAVARVGDRTVVLRRELRRVTGVIDLRGLPKGRFVVDATITLHDGRVIRDTRAYRTCEP